MGSGASAREIALGSLSNQFLQESERLNHHSHHLEFSQASTPPPPPRSTTTMSEIKEENQAVDAFTGQKMPQLNSAPMLKTLKANRTLKWGLLLCLLSLKRLLACPFWLQHLSEPDFWRHHSIGRQTRLQVVNNASSSPGDLDHCTYLIRPCRDRRHRGIFVTALFVYYAHHGIGKRDIAPSG